MGATSMNFATAVMVLTPKDPSLAPITVTSEGFFNEEEFLGEPQPDKERARYFADNSGNTGQYIDIFAIAGKRDLTVFDGPEADKLQKYSYSNPQPLFDCAVTYQRNDQDASQRRTHLHSDCKFVNHPARVMSNDVATLKFSLHYGKLQIVDGAGNPVA